MLQWHPTFTIRSERRAWVQALRGVAYFGVGSALVVGVIAGGSVAKRSWDRHQAQRAEHAQYAALGLRQICGPKVDTDCLRRAAITVNVPVVSEPTRFAELVVSTGPPKLGATAGFLPIPQRATEVRYAAFEQVEATVDRLGFALVTAPSSRPARRQVRMASVRVGGVTVDMWIERGYGPVLDVWAEWNHRDHLYAAWFIVNSDLGTPAEFLNDLLPTLRYTAPS